MQLWEQFPRQLVSWYDMLHFSASRFFWCGRSLRTIRADCIAGSAICVNGEPAFAMTKDLDGMALERAIGGLAPLEEEFSRVGLRISAETVKELHEELQSQSRHNFQWLHDQIEVIEKLVEKELKGKTFFYVPPERMRFWPSQKEPFAFGRAVATSFPSTTWDANSAAFCVAVTLSTAAVFHLMRVLEIGLTVLGAKFGTSLAHTNWAPAIEQIESKIRDMHKDPAWKALPDCKEQQEFYAQAASHFAILKDAWRNYTMHVRGKYMEEESERIFDNVKAFMQKLAEGLKE
jgi:hypothetical protein